MPKVVIVGDDMFLKNVTETSSVLQKIGNLSSDEAEDVINSVLYDEEVVVEVDDVNKAEQLAATLNRVIGVKATVKS
jgi:predicted nucleic-acid-binding protein